MESLTEIMRRNEKPAVHLVHTDGPSKSHLGGEPSLPADVAWPKHKGRKLPFLARISLRDVQAALPIEWLPKDGALLFFLSDDDSTWGGELEDKGAWRVLHVPDVAEPAGSESEQEPPTQAVANPRPSFFARLFGKVEKADGPLMDGGFRSRFPFVPLACRIVQTLPAQIPVGPNDDVPDDLADDYAEAIEGRYGDAPKHSIDGHAFDFQDDEMELRCQEIYDRLHRKKPAGSENDGSPWRLLFQLGSDEDAQMMWGDVGLLFFWVRADEAAAGNFDNVWMFMQCC